MFLKIVRAIAMTIGFIVMLPFVLIISGWILFHLLQIIVLVHYAFNS